MLETAHQLQSPTDSGVDSLPSGSLAMTTPLPARAENRKPALKTVNIANPLEPSRTLLGITYANESRNSVYTVLVTRDEESYAVKTTVFAIHE